MRRTIKVARIKIVRPRRSTHYYLTVALQRRLLHGVGRPFGRAGSSLRRSPNSHSLDITLELKTKVVLRKQWRIAVSKINQGFSNVIFPLSKIQTSTTLLAFANRPTMPHAVTMPSAGFQALILCGPGVSFNTFTADPEEFPKALIPIANRPMIWYPLDWCYRMGITGMSLKVKLRYEDSLATSPCHVLCRFYSCIAVSGQKHSPENVL